MNPSCKARMTVTYSEAPSVAQRAAELGLSTPTGITVLPQNFFEANTAAELVHDRDVLTIRKLWRQAGIVETPLEPEDQPFPRSLNRSANWVTPVVFVGGLLLSENPLAVSLALNIVTDRLTDLFRWRLGDHDVTLDVIVEKHPELGTSKRISYKGPLEGIRQLGKVIEDMINED
jgi:hypothetical protein